jgi:hypothetical protein
MPAIARLPICSLCNEPVEIETAKTDENGDAVHGDCYVVKIRPKTSQPCHVGLDGNALPEHIAISPMTLTCPRCGAKAGEVCELFDGEVEVVHVARIEAAAAREFPARKT